MDYDKATALKMDFTDLKQIMKDGTGSTIKAARESLTKARDLALKISKDHTELRPKLLRVMNTYSSIVDEIVQADLTIPQARSEIAKVMKPFDTVVSSYITANLDSVKGSPNMDTEVKDARHRNASIKAHLSALAKKGVPSEVLAPVLPVFKQSKFQIVKNAGGLQPIQDQTIGISRTALHKLGVPHSAMFGHTVLEKQTVICIPNSYVEKMVKDHSADQTKIDKKKFEEINELYSDVVEVFLHKHPGWEAIEPICTWGGARWYWIIDRKVITLIRKAIPGGTFAVTGWGFAF